MEVEKDIFVVRLPLPFRTDHVNCYLARGSHSWSMIDTGFNYPPSLYQWEKTFSQYGIAHGDIERIYITHMHPSHFGAAKWMQELTGAPIYMSGIEIENVDRTWKKGRINLPVLGELFKENGVSQELLPEVLDNIKHVVSAVCPCPVLSPLPEDGEVEIGRRMFRVIHTPGHSEGHVSFFNQEEGLLFSGDHLLPVSESRICMWPTSNPNPIKQFFESLEIVAKLPVKKVFPAHGEVFSNYLDVVNDLVNYYHDRLRQIVKLSGKGTNAYQICNALFKKKFIPSYIHYDLTEILAFLAYLESKAQVDSRLENDVITYRKMNVR